eukprot:1308965-Amphidinium_carterae.3
MLRDQDLTVASRAIAFKLLSRIAALVYELLYVPHERYPFKLFLAIHDSQKAQELLSVEDCVLDSFSLAAKRAYPHLGAPFLDMLHAHCLTVATNTAPIEAKHASIRRQLQARVQTWSQMFVVTSAEFVCGALRSRRRSHLLLAKACKQGRTSKQVAGRKLESPLIAFFI